MFTPNRSVLALAPGAKFRAQGCQDCQLVWRVTSNFIAPRVYEQTTLEAHTNRKHLLAGESLTQSRIEVKIVLSYQTSTEASSTFNLQSVVEITN